MRLESRTRSISREHAGRRGTSSLGRWGRWAGVFWCGEGEGEGQSRLYADGLLNRARRPPPAPPCASPPPPASSGAVQTRVLTRRQPLATPRLSSTRARARSNAFKSSRVALCLFASPRRPPCPSTLAPPPSPSLTPRRYVSPPHPRAPRLPFKGPPEKARRNARCLAPRLRPLSPSSPARAFQGKGRTTYLCEGKPAKTFLPTPGLWFSNQSDAVQDALYAAYARQPCPSKAEMEVIAKEVGAPGVAQVRCAAVVVGGGEGKSGTNASCAEAGGMRCCAFSNAAYAARRLRPSS